jgi:hypothetical protein
MGTENVVYIHNGVLLSHKEEWNYDIFRKTHGPGNHVNWNITDKYCIFSLMCRIYIWKNDIKVEEGLFGKRIIGGGGARGGSMVGWILSKYIIYLYENVRMKPIKMYKK